MLGPVRSDRSHEGLVNTRDLISARRRSDPESGQAMVEFALVLFPLLLLVVGIIQFGIGLNFWLDEQRIANQGARWAVVNSWPDCPRAPAIPPPSPCLGATVGAGNSLPTYLHDQALSNGLRKSVVVSVCYPDDGDASTPRGSVGTPVRVKLKSDFDFLPIVGIGTITLRADATMRLEQTPSHLDPALLTQNPACS